MSAFWPPWIAPAGRDPRTIKPDINTTAMPVARHDRTVSHP